jgi:outer membrane protein OmpA-like peptidoglycan-associated protein
MTKVGRSIFLFLVLVWLGGCATLPTGPSVMVLPPANKSFEEFQAEDATCRQWAAQQIGQSPQQTVNQNTAAGAVGGTLLGAGLGAAIGSASAAVGVGAAIGAASGLLVGTAAGAYAGQAYGWEAQRRYDIAYKQCMYAYGNLIPGVVTRTRSIRRVPPPPPPPPPDLRTVPPDYYPPPHSAPPPKVIDKITLMIHFDTDKSDIRQSDEAELKRAIDFVKKYPGSQVRVEGSTDSVGTDQYNRKLSEKRAETVRNYLVQKGAVDASKITSAGYGEKRPVVSNETTQGRAQNRRVEILIQSD